MTYNWLPHERDANWAACRFVVEQFGGPGTHEELAGPHASLFRDCEPRTTTPLDLRLLSVGVLLPDGLSQLADRDSLSPLAVVRALGGPAAKAWQNLDGDTKAELGEWAERP